MKNRIKRTLLVAVLVVAGSLGHMLVHAGDVRCGGRKMLKGTGASRDVLVACPTCEMSDGGEACSALSALDRSYIRNKLLVNCPDTMFWGAMDQCCLALMELPWKDIESCLCGGLDLLGVTGFINADDIMSSCGCSAMRNNQMGEGAAPGVDGSRSSSSSSGSNGSSSSGSLAG